MTTAAASALAFAMTAACLGLFLGLLYFAALRRSIDCYSHGRRLKASALTLGRLLCALMFFALVAKLGALPLVSALFGFLLARTLALRRKIPVFVSAGGPLARGLGPRGGPGIHEQWHAFRGFLVDARGRAGQDARARAEPFECVER